MPSSPGPGRLRRLPEDGSQLLSGMPGQLPGLHRPVYLLQISPGLRHLGTVPQGGQKALPGKSGGKGQRGKKRRGLRIKAP